MSTVQTVLDPAGSVVLRRRTAMVVLATVLLLAQVLPLMALRWVADESWYSSAASNLALKGELRVPVFAEFAMQGRVQNNAPFYMVSAAAIFKIFGTSVYTAKILPAISGLCGVLLTYLLGCELEGIFLGALGTAFLVVDNMYVFASRTARPEALTTTMMLAGVLLFLYARRRRSLGLAFLAGIAVGLAGQSHPSGLAAAIIAGVLSFQEFGIGLIRRGRPWMFLLGLVISVLPYLLWATSDQVHRTEFINMYTTGEQHTLSEIPSLEFHRYEDYLGMPSQRLRLPIPLPYRLHVVLALLAAVLVLFRWNRTLLRQLLTFIVPCALWWALIRNPSVRYTATASPYLALLLAGAAIALWKNRPQSSKLVVAACILLMAAEAGSNYAFLYFYRKADMAKVAHQLHTIIPPDAGIYGALPFWIAFPYQRFYSWNRTPLPYALAHGVTYLILNDKIMTEGNGFGEDDWQTVRQTAQDFVHRGNAILVGRAPNPYYGDLEIYRLK